MARWLSPLRALAPSALLVLAACGARNQLLEGGEGSLTGGGGAGNTASSTATTAVGDTATSTGSGTMDVCTGEALVPFDPPTGSTCGCPPAAGFTLEGDCGPLVLDAPFIHPPELEVSCGTSVPFGESVICERNFGFTVGACRDEGHAPCVLLQASPDPNTGTFDATGFFVDGAGANWPLEDLFVNGALGPTGLIEGSFDAVARSADGQTLGLSGTFQICSAVSIVCPK